MKQIILLLVVIILLSSCTKDNEIIKITEIHYGTNFLNLDYGITEIIFIEEATIFINKDLDPGKSENVCFKNYQFINWEYLCQIDYNEFFSHPDSIGDLNQYYFEWFKIKLSNNNEYKIIFNPEDFYNKINGINKEYIDNCRKVSELTNVCYSQ